MDDFFWEYISGFTIAIISGIYLITKSLANKEPIQEVLDDFENNPLFAELRFKKGDHNTIYGEINHYKIELTPQFKEDSQLSFKLIIDLQKKPYAIDQTDLKHVLKKYKIELTKSRLIINTWEPNIFNFGNFNKVIAELEKLIILIESNNN
mgnify:CR=1 FL=1